MARQNTRNGNTRRGREERVKEYDALIRYASAIVLLAAGVLLALAVFGAAGPIGAAVFSASYLVVGIGAFLLPIALIAVGFYAGFGRPSIAPLTTSGLLLVAASVLAFAGLLPGATFGGMTGTWLGGALSAFFGFWGALVLLVATLAVGVAIAIDIKALVALMTENVSSLFDRIRRPKSSEDNEEWDDVVGVPLDD